MNCVCAQTRHAARVLTRMYEESLRPAELTPAQFELMAVLAAQPDVAQSTLADAMGLDQTTLSRNVRPLAARKWLTMRLSREDRRQVTYRLSAAGRRQYEKAIPLWQNAQKRVQEQLGGQWESVQTALGLLQGVTD